MPTIQNIKDNPISSLVGLLIMLICIFLFVYMYLKPQDYEWMHFVSLFVGFAIGVGLVFAKDRLINAILNKLSSGNNKG